jgi:hypothetical protein
MSHRIFKFLRSEHVGCILKDGTVQFGRLSHYRGLEKTHGPWIGDQHEGTSAVTVEVLEWTATDDLAANEEMARRFSPGPGGLKFAPGSKVSMYGAPGAIKHTSVGDDEFVFSVAVGGLKKLTRTMCVDAKDPYDACLELKCSLKTLAEEIYHSGRIPGLHNGRIRELFHRPTFGKVTYRQIVQNFGAPVPQPSPFAKDLFYKEQKEWRICLKPLNDRSIPPGSMIVHGPRIPKLFTHVQLDLLCRRGPSEADDVGRHSGSART